MYLMNKTVNDMLEKGSKMYDQLPNPMPDFNQGVTAGDWCMISAYTLALESYVNMISLEQQRFFDEDNPIFGWLIKMNSTVTKNKVWLSEAKDHLIPTVELFDDEPLAIPASVA